ncbi:T9SS type A sorting domain-containing protein [Winogradskyella sp.]|uniref:T9SS type A sorting domain-containing protein n=1 Tax=Winogradskyella sp. TaxID=1883156 RepID=UPI003BAC7043
MKIKTAIILLTIGCMYNIHAQNITLTFANAEVTNDGTDDFYEADIMLSSTIDFYVGSGQVYIDYNTAAFGENIAANANIEYTQPTGSLIGYSFPSFPFPVPTHKDFIQIDNTTSRVSLSFQQNLGVDALALAPSINVTTTPKVLMHIKIKYVDANANAGICFYSDGVFQDQFITACGGAPVTGLADCTNAPGVVITNDTYDCSGASLNSTYIYNNGWSPSDPNGVSTASDDIDIVAGSATISSDTSCDNITVQAGAGITVNNGVTLTTASGMVMESTSTSYSSIILNGTITGTVTYRRHVNQTASSGGNDLISPPVSGETFDNLLASNGNIVANGDSSQYLFGPFDKTSGTYQTYASTETVALTSGTGYRAATTDNGTLNFSGSIDQSNVNVAVSNSGPSYSEWNLIGNPYASYLNVQDFLNNVANAALLDEANVGIYGYDGDASDGWTVYNLNTTDANTVITPGQGFFVAAESNGTIAFTPSMRRHGNSDDFIAGRNGTNHHLKLQLTSANDSSTTDFYFNDSSTNSLDPGYDAAVFGNTADSFALYSQLLGSNEDADFAIQSLPRGILLNGTMIPLGVNADSGQQLGIDIDTTNLPDTVEVYLIDTVENVSALLNTTAYVFTPSVELNGTGRFYLSFSNTALSIDDSGIDKLNVRFVKDRDRIVVIGQLMAETRAELYDINGRLVKTIDLDMAHYENTMSTRGLERGVYIFVVDKQGRSESYKVIIN